MFAPLDLGEYVAAAGQEAARGPHRLPEGRDREGAEGARQG